MGADATARPDHPDRRIPPTDGLFVPRCRVVSAYQPHDPTDVGLKRMVSAVIDVGIAYIIYFALFAVLSKPNVVVFSSFSSRNECGGAGLCLLCYEIGLPGARSSSRGRPDDLPPGQIRS